MKEKLAGKAKESRDAKRKLQVAERKERARFHQADSLEKELEEKLKKGKAPTLRNGMMYCHAEPTQHNEVLTGRFRRDGDHPAPMDFVGSPEGILFVL
jgi:hypothetical protein